MPEKQPRLSPEEAQENIERFNKAAAAEGLPKMSEYSRLDDVQTAEELLKEEGKYTPVEHKERKELMKKGMRAFTVMWDVLPGIEITPSQKRPYISLGGVGHHGGPGLRGWRQVMLGHEFADQKRLERAALVEKEGRMLLVDGRTDEERALVLVKMPGGKRGGNRVEWDELPPGVKALSGSEGSLERLIVMEPDTEVRIKEISISTFGKPFTRETIVIRWDGENLQMEKAKASGNATIDNSIK